MISLYLSKQYEAGQLLCTYRCGARTVNVPVLKCHAPEAVEEGTSSRQITVVETSGLLPILEIGLPGGSNDAITLQRNGHACEPTLKCLLHSLSFLHRQYHLRPAILGNLDSLTSIFLSLPSHPLLVPFESLHTSILTLSTPNVKVFVWA